MRAPLLWMWLAGAAAGPPVIAGDAAQPAWAGAEAVGTTPRVPSAPPTELRGIWITRWTCATPSEVRAVMADVAAAGFNTVFFQVRGTFDALYDSRIEPWSELLTGRLGQDPGWDPLAVAVEEGHVQGLRVHAYINAFPLWRGPVPPPASRPAHALNTHPGWRVADPTGRPMPLQEGYVFASPGHPEVQRRVAAVARDIADRYAVDGIHLDYIRYPGPDTSHDATSDGRFYTQPPGQDRADWQRAQVKATVAGVSAAVAVPVTAAVWGVYEDAWGWGRVSEGNRDYYQDSRAFLEEGLLDANIPMIYWPVSDEPGGRLDFRTLVADHVDHSAGRHVYAGLGGELLGFDEAVACIRSARRAGADGVVLFDYTLFAADLHRLRDSVFAEDAVPPAMPWR